MQNRINNWLDPFSTYDQLGGGYQIVQSLIAIASGGTFGRGLGLGLTVCYAIVKAHGGEMTVENRPEGGARVSLWLPGVKQEEENSCEAL